jgi:hypothetical protein
MRLALILVPASLAVAFATAALPEALGFGAESAPLVCYRALDDRGVETGSVGDVAEADAAPHDVAEQPGRCPRSAEGPARRS